MKLKELDNFITVVYLFTNEGMIKDYESVSGDNFANTWCSLHNIQGAARLRLLTNPDKIAKENTHKDIYDAIKSSLQLYQKLITDDINFLQNVLNVKRVHLPNTTLNNMLERLRKRTNSIELKENFVYND